MSVNVSLCMLSRGDVKETLRLVAETANCLSDSDLIEVTVTQTV